jgi:hypothetical protein
MCSRQSCFSLGVAGGCKTADVGIAVPTGPAVRVLRTPGGGAHHCASSWASPSCRGEMALASAKVTTPLALPPCRCPLSSPACCHWTRTSHRPRYFGMGPHVTVSYIINCCVQAGNIAVTGSFGYVSSLYKVQHVEGMRILTKFTMYCIWYTGHIHGGWCSLCCKFFFSGSTKCVHAAACVDTTCGQCSCTFIRACANSCCLEERWVGLSFYCAGLHSHG